jgi:hypothetical protein
MRVRTEADFLVEESTRVLGCAIDVIQFSVGASNKSDMIAELAAAMRDVPAIVRTAGSPPTLSENGVSSLRFAIEEGNRIMREMERMGPVSKGKGLQKLKSVWTVMTQQ